MILRDKPGPMELAFALRGSIIPAILRPLIALMVLAALLTWVETRASLLPRVEPSAVAVFGAALSLFLGFRNNAAYDRWWEARRLWGGLLADLRTLARELEVFVPEAALRQAMLGDALAFLHLHRVNLRRLTGDAEAARWGAAYLNAPHPPCAALDRMSARLAAATQAGQVDGFGARTLTGRIASLTQQQAGCERIALTPLPFVYSLLIYRTTYLYCLLLPLGLVGTAGWLTPLIVGIVAYVFLGLAEVSEELSHPFGTQLNALPLDAICRAAEISLAPHMGLPVPAPMQPKDYYLS
jgi:putative membrane protein